MLMPKKHYSCLFSVSIFRGLALYYLTGEPWLLLMLAMKFINVGPDLSYRFVIRTDESTPSQLVVEFPSGFLTFVRVRVLATGAIEICSSLEASSTLRAGSVTLWKVDVRSQVFL